VAGLAALVPRWGIPGVPVPKVMAGYSASDGGAFPA
jgi:hypothetical protein